MNDKLSASCYPHNEVWHCSRHEFWVSRTYESRALSAVAVSQTRQKFLLLVPPSTFARPSLNIITQNTRPFFSTVYQRYFSSSFRPLKKPFGVRMVFLSRPIEISRMRLSGRVLFIPLVFDRSWISNAVYDFCPVTSRVLNKNRLLGLSEIGGNFNARMNRPRAATLELVPCIVHDLTNGFQDANRHKGTVWFPRSFTTIFYVSHKTFSSGSR